MKIMDLMITEYGNPVLRGDAIKHSEDIAGTYAHTSLSAETTCSATTMSPKRMRISEIMEFAPTGCENLVLGENSEKKEQVRNEHEKSVLHGSGCKDRVLPKLTRWQEVLSHYIPHRKIGIDGRGKLPFTSEELKEMTADFSDKNFLGFTQFEMLYRGNMKDDDGAEFPVVVKICNLVADRKHTNIDWILRIIDEIKFLEDPTMKGHRNLVDMIGYCEEGTKIGVVYDLDPLDTLHNIILKGSLNLKQTFKIALALAELLEFFHSKDYLLRNLTPFHVIIDRNLRPRLVDFILLTGGVMGNRMGMEGEYHFRTRGYMAPEYRYSMEYDVYVYGIILMSLIAKKGYDKHASVPLWVNEWAAKEYAKPELRSLVHGSLQLEMDDDVGEDVTKLAMHCLEEQKEKRPTMKQVVGSLKLIMVNHILERRGRRRPEKTASGRHS